ncbi:hypothetical protein [uncultured Kordia sp.]|uniref:hypothetical protein n=1 Tax=uncultured Kordia sp. TaxID=507699 RepID=UPI002635F815|nr:hypothetical protein [uncultured Kordia sp.]
MKKIYLICALCLSVMISNVQAQSNNVFVTETSESITPFIDKLQDGEQFTIHYKSTGCFHNAKETMTFLRENNSYYVIYKKERKALTDDSIQNIRDFEKQLAQQHSYGCTTVDNYLVIYNDVQRIATDGSCSWNGYGKLKKLFGFTA